MRSMSLELKTPFLPMEARLVDEPPVGPAWQYEPKWDGFRAIASIDAEGKVALTSRAELVGYARDRGLLG